MEPNLPLSVLMAPLVLAAMAVAALNLFARRQEAEAEAPPRPAEVPKGSPPDRTLTPRRYVGGHPDRPHETPAPLVALDREGLRVSPGPKREPAFAIRWQDVEAITELDARQMRFAVGSVRGLSPDAIPEDRDDAVYLRIRHTGSQGYWHSTIFELDPAHAAAQVEAIRASHGQYEVPPPAAEASPDA